MTILAILWNLFKSLMGIGYNNDTDSMKDQADMLRELLAKKCPGGIYMDADINVAYQYLYYNNNQGIGKIVPISGARVPKSSYYNRIIPSSQVSIDFEDAAIKELYDVWVQHLIASGLGSTGWLAAAPDIGDFHVEFEFMNSGDQPQNFDLVTKSAEKTTDGDAAENDTNTMICSAHGLTVADIGKFVMPTGGTGHIGEGIIRKIEDIPDVDTIILEDGYWITGSTQGSTVMLSGVNFVILSPKAADDAKMVRFQMPDGDGARVIVKVKIIPEVDGVDLSEFYPKFVFTNHKVSWEVGYVTGEHDTDFAAINFDAGTDTVPETIQITGEKFHVAGSFLSKDYGDDMSVFADEDLAWDDSDKNTIRFTIHAGPTGRLFDHFYNQEDLSGMLVSNRTALMNTFGSTPTLFTFYDTAPTNWSHYIWKRRAYLDITHYDGQSTAYNQVPIQLAEYKRGGDAFFIMVHVSDVDSAITNFISDDGGTADAIILKYQEEEGSFTDTPSNGMSIERIHSTIGTEDAYLRWKVTINDSGNVDYKDTYRFIIAEQTAEVGQVVKAKIIVNVVPGIGIFLGAVDTNNLTVAGSTQYSYDNAAIYAGQQNRTYTSAGITNYIRPGVVGGVTEDYRISLQYVTPNTAVGAFHEIDSKTVRARPTGGESFSTKIVLRHLSSALKTSFDTTVNFKVYFADLNTDNTYHVYPSPENVSALQTMTWANPTTGVTETLDYIDVTFTAAQMHDTATNIGVGTVLVAEIVGDDGNTVNSFQTTVYIPPIMTLDGFTDVVNSNTIAHTIYGASGSWTSYVNEENLSHIYYSNSGYYTQCTVYQGFGPLTLSAQYAHRIDKVFHENYQSDVPERPDPRKNCYPSYPDYDHDVLYCTNYPSNDSVETAAISTDLNQTVVNGQATTYAKHSWLYLPGSGRTSIQERIASNYGHPDDLISSLVINMGYDKGTWTPRQWT